MTKSDLNPAQLKTVELIEALQFGSIEGLAIQDGFPNYEIEPRIVQDIKLDAVAEVTRNQLVGDRTLKNNFELLFDQFRRLKNGAVAVEVRHSLPFRLVIERNVDGLI
jgi:hypothetical protein